jgi:hypothetical protein
MIGKSKCQNKYLISIGLETERSNLIQNVIVSFDEFFKS